MRFTYSETMTDPAYYLPLVRAAEEAGYDSFAVPDSLCYPRDSDSVYPFTPDGDRRFLEDKPFLDPFTLIAAMGAVTERIRFCTFVVKLPIRQPVIVAKQAGSLAVLTGNRFDFGVGVSPWPEDFDVTGVPFERRGKRMDECLDIIKGLTSGDYFEYVGEFFELQPVKMCPVPSKPVPILIGGHSEAALRRAARYGDGWMHGGGDPDELARMMGRLAELRKIEGRDHLPFSITAISFDAFTVDGVRKLEDQGVTDVIVGFRWPYTTDQDTEPLQTKIDNLRMFADSVVAKTREG